MKKETLQHRIEKAEADIAKKQGTIQKKAGLVSRKTDKLRALGYSHEDQPAPDAPAEAFELMDSIDMLEYDLERLRKEVSGIQSRLEGYRADMEAAIQKENSRDVEVILQFLENWKKEVKKFYLDHVNDWVSTLAAYYKANKEYCEWYNGHFRERKDKEILKKMEKPMKEAKAAHAVYSYLDPYMFREGNDYRVDLEKLQRDLDHEADCKYDFIIERTNEIVGQITDASGLSIGRKGDLNGLIIGTIGTAKIQTIGAGGYNIQCYHFRTLVHPVTVS